MTRFVTKAAALAVAVFPLVGVGVAGAQTQAVDEKTVEARFSIANGYYLYREKLKFAVDPAMLAGALAAMLAATEGGLLRDSPWYEAGWRPGPYGAERSLR